MKKRLSENAFDCLKDSCPVMTKEEMLQLIGGSTCVIYCFAYVAGISYEWYAMTASAQGYLASGGVAHEDMAAVGLIGGLNVSRAEDEIFNNSTGKLLDGASMMMTFNNNGEDHAVIVTHIDRETGVISYYDPSTNEDGVRPAKEYSAMYYVGNF